VGPSQVPSIVPTIAPSQVPSASPSIDPTGLADTSAPSAAPSTSQTPSIKTESPTVTAAPTENESEEDEGFFSSASNIAIVAGAGGGGLLMLAIGGYFFMNRAGAGGGAGAAYASADNKGDLPANAIVGGYGDDVSTLEDNQNKTGMRTADELHGYGGDQSVATVDYDYSKAYGGGGNESVVSSAGGTFGSNTLGQSTTVSGPGVAGGVAAGAAVAGAAAVGASAGGSYSDDESFEAQYRNNYREETIEVLAPPGKLGVVIDTPNDGAPVVHAIKDSSVIANQLQVGDKLTMVDDDDVRSMTAIKVSKLISRKSANATRKLTIIRTIMNE